jgi:hypothetical protein
MSVEKARIRQHAGKRAKPEPAVMRYGRDTKRFLTFGDALSSARHLDLTHGPSPSERFAARAAICPPEHRLVSGTPFSTC